MKLRAKTEKDIKPILNSRKIAQKEKEIAQSNIQSAVEQSYRTIRDAIVSAVNRGEDYCILTIGFVGDTQKIRDKIRDELGITIRTMIAPKHGAIRISDGRVVEIRAHQLFVMIEKENTQ